MKKVDIEDIMDTFECTEKQAEKIKDLFQDLIFETLDKDAERKEVPF